MNTINNLKQNFDLYGSEVVLSYLKTKYFFVSIRNGSIPTAGSVTKKTSLLLDDVKIEISRFISHKNGDITLITNYGYLRFTN